SADLISRTIDAARESGAALAALAARDTVKRADRVDGRGFAVRETLPRETIFLAQTPQAFRRDVLDAALAAAARDAIEATAEGLLAERAGHTVRVVEGEATNNKITTAEDLIVAEAIARRSAEAFALQGDSSSERSAGDSSSEREGFSRAKPARTGRAGT